MRNTQSNFWKIVKFTVPIDHYRIGRVLEISFAISHLVYTYRDYLLGINESG
jgi:hypothetical protein